MRKMVILVAVMASVMGLRAQKPQTPPKPVLPYDKETKLVTYEETINVPGAGQAELFTRAKEWVYKYYKNPAGILRTMDSVNGKIECRHKLRIFNELDGSRTPAGFINYSVYIFVRDGKYKYRVTQLEQHDTTPIPIEMWLDDNASDKVRKYDYLRQTDEFVRLLIKDLTAGMQKREAGKKVNEW